MVIILTKQWLYLYPLSVTSWVKEQYVILQHPPFLCATCFQSKMKMRSGLQRATIQLKGVVIGIDDKDDCTFTIWDQTKMFRFRGNIQEICVMSGDHVNSHQPYIITQVNKKIL